LRQDSAQDSAQASKLGLASRSARNAAVATIALLLAIHVAAAANGQAPNSARPQTEKLAAPGVNKVSPAPALEAGFQWLFDGQTLSGWEGKKKWFRVEDGSIVAGSLSEKIPNNEFLCTEQKYGDFELRLQVRLKGEGNNAGIQFRSERVANDHEVSGYQCDVGSAFGRSVWGALYDESRRNKMLAEGTAEDVNRWTQAGQWNDLSILCRADRIQLSLNGHPTVDYREPDAQLSRTGVIGLQIHAGPPTEAWYRAIRIRIIKKDS